MLNGTRPSASLYERSIYERTFMSEPIENYVIPNKPSNHNRGKKRHRTFRRHREPSRIPLRTLQRLSNKTREVREFVYKCVCSSTRRLEKCIAFFKVRKHKLKLKSSKTLRKSIFKLKSRIKRYYSLFSCKRVVSLQD